MGEHLIGKTVETHDPLGDYAAGANFVLKVMDAIAGAVIARPDRGGVIVKSRGGYNGGILDLQEMTRKGVAAALADARKAAVASGAGARDP